MTGDYVMALDLKITIQDISKYKLDCRSICYHKQLIEDLSSRGTVQKKVHMIFYFYADRNSNAQTDNQMLVSQKG